MSMAEISLAKMFVPNVSGPKVQKPLSLSQVWNSQYGDFRLSKTAGLGSCSSMANRGSCEAGVVLWPYISVVMVVEFHSEAGGIQKVFADQWAPLKDFLIPCKITWGRLANNLTFSVFKVNFLSKNQLNLPENDLRIKT